MAAKTMTRMIMVMIRKLEVIQYIWNLRLHDMRKLEVVHKEVGGCTFGI